jgi:hypothetical protein
VLLGAVVVLGGAGSSSGGDVAEVARCRLLPSPQAGGGRSAIRQKS